MASQPGNPVYNDVFHHIMFINKEWVATNQWLCCKLGRGTSHGENSDQEAGEFVLIYDLPPKTSTNDEYKSLHPCWPQFPQ